MYYIQFIHKNKNVIFLTLSMYMSLQCANSFSYHTKIYIMKS